jgi:CRP/FNR family transcriptional activator FtrB
MRTEEIDEMRRLPLFAGVAPACTEAMLQAAVLRRFPARVELVREGDPADFLHVVVDGQVEVFAAYRDRETTLSVLSAGRTFIAAAVVLDRVYLKSARTLEPARILMIPGDTLRQYFGEDAGLARALALELAENYRGLVRELKNQKLRSSIERLANWLLNRHAETGAAGTFELPFDKRVLAARLGMAPEALSRAFASLVPYRVAVKGPTVRIDDLGALQKLAQPASTIDDPGA